MIYKQAKLSLTDSLRKHFPVSYGNLLRTPVQITVEDHEIRIKAYLEFSRKLLIPYVNKANDDGKADFDRDLAVKPEGFTFADAVCEGIEKNWAGLFEFPWYSHLLKSTVKLTTTIVRKDKDEGSYDPKQRFVKVTTSPYLIPSSFVMSRWWRWVWGIFYCGSPESFTLNWSPSFPGTIHMKRYKNLTRYEQVAAHEFGHILGIGDAYDAPYRFFYQLPNVSAYMMCFNRHVQSEELQMVLKAHLTRRMQYFPYKFVPKIFFKGLIDHFKN